MSVLADEPDADLWRLSLAGSGDAFGVLFDRYRRPVYRHCLARTESPSSAEDLVSATFLEAWRLRGKLDLVGASLLPWLLAVSNNLIANQQRALRRYHRLLSRLPRSPDSVDAAADVDTRLDAARRMRPAMHAFNTLTTDEREVISLCDLAGLSHLDAAAALGVPVGTVKSRLNRARGHLRSALNESSERPRPDNTDGTQRPSHSLLYLNLEGQAR